MALLGRVEELALIARTLAGDDRRAYQRLVETHQERLRRFLMGLTGGDVCLVDDLAQEAFIKAYTGLRSFRATSRFNTWLTTIAVREYIDWQRTNHSELTLDDIPPPTDDGGAYDTEARHDVQVALAALAPLDRSIVMMFYFEDMPVKKIAAAVDLNEGNVRVRLHRAKSLMAKALTPVF